VVVEGINMGDGNSQHIYLKALLDMGDLDIRRISRDYLDLRIGEYFKTVEKFVNRIPMVLEAMDKIVSEKAADYDFRTLKDIKQYLEDIGYDKCSIIDDVAKAGKRGHSKFAAGSAKKMLGDFTRFCKRITAVQKESAAKVRAYAPGANDITPESYKEQFLKDVLQQLDNPVNTRRLKILAVDDSPVALKSITSALNNDYDVFTVADPLNVEEILQKITPDLFLLDYKMPEINGFELLPIIRGFAEHKDTPIIYLTAFGTPDYVATALALGACDYIVKPFLADNLRSKVAKHITKKK